MTDYTDKLVQEGAARLALDLQKYWSDRGYYVTTYLEQFAVVNRVPLFGVRSDMINGLPKDWSDK